MELESHTDTQNLLIWKHLCITSPSSHIPGHLFLRLPSQQRQSIDDPHSQRNPYLRSVPAVTVHYSAPDRLEPKGMARSNSVPKHPFPLPLWHTSPSRRKGNEWSMALSERRRRAAIMAHVNRSEAQLIAWRHRVGNLVAKTSEILIILETFWKYFGVFLIFGSAF